MYTSPGEQQAQNLLPVFIRDAAGNLYGTTAYGGNSIRCQGGCGTILQAGHGR